MFVLIVGIEYFTLDNQFLNGLIIFHQLFAYLYGLGLIYKSLFLKIFWEWILM